ncbi:ATP-grasp domain-containing protein [Butyrivibrio sp. FCS014]|uniref:ATP-grasp domain-containing protein n=1 Tax=Butyrivibrio sp. FCS014 TaxID=1408304 RepID=UPI0004B97443|nr:hypothetical protein [Butyrivibrio sp. FCS014]
MGLSGYLIEKYNNMAGAYTCNRLVEEAKRLGIDLRIIGIHDTNVTADGIFNCGQLLGKRDFVINRYKWGKLKDRINELGERSYNDIHSFNRYINKYQQLRDIKSLDFLVPKYVLGTALLPYEEVVRKVGTPFVAKGLESSMGEQISLVESPEDYRRLLDTYGPEKELLFEEYISTSYGRDMRIFSLRGEVIAGMIRKSQGDFRANVALGASVEPLEITDSIRLLARDIYLCSSVEFVGIDLLFGEDKPYFCEINVMPGLEGIEESSGKNIAGMIMETIKGDFEDEQTGS